MAGLHPWQWRHKAADHVLDSRQEAKESLGQAVNLKAQSPATPEVPLPFKPVS